ncbi:MAG: hypothetical protein R3E77_15100 [Steroidobacteraceae bacterium]
MLIISQFLGTMPQMQLAVANAFDVHALVLVILGGATLLSLGRLPQLRHAQFLGPVTLLLALWLLAVLLPVARRDSSLWFAIQGSREFMMVFAYIPATLFFRSERDSTWAWRSLIALGIAYCCIELVAQLGGATLLRRLTYSYRPDFYGLWKVYFPFWTVILVAAGFGFYMYLAGRRRYLWLLFVGLAGVLLTFYRSYALATMVAFPLVAVLAKRSKAIRSGATMEVAALITGGLLLVGLAAGGLKVVSNYSEQFAGSGVTELAGKAGSSLLAREAYATVLRPLAQERPLLGYGFIYRKAAVMSKLHLSAFAGSVLGFVDRGDMDLRIKFGYLGGLVLLLAFCLIAWRCIAIARATAEPELAASSLTIAAVIVTGFMVLPVHAPFSYSFSLLPLAIALGIVDGQVIRRRHLSSAERFVYTHPSSGSGRVRDQRIHSGIR